MTHSLAIAECNDEKSWEGARKLRNKYFFDPLNIKDPYTWTFNNALHVHSVFYQDLEIVGYAHVQLWPEHRAAIRIIVIDEEKRARGLGKKFLTMVEELLKSKGIKSVHAESRASSLGFYTKNGYVLMPFNDPDGYDSSNEDIPVGKTL